MSDPLLVDIGNGCKVLHDGPCHREYQRLKSELSALEKDALRYRWLRKGEPNVIHGATATQQSGSGPFTSMVLPGAHARQVLVYDNVLDEQIDTAIDLARGQL